MKQEIHQFAFIDALRGYAVLLVLLVHSSQKIMPNSSLLKSFTDNGQIGVQLFFVVSAMTLCMSWYFRQIHELSPIRNFFIRRFFRIAPLFYVAIVFYVGTNGFGPTYFAPSGIDWIFIGLTTLFLHGFHPETINSVVPGGWSIAVEMSFYLTLPVLLHYLNSTKRLVIFFVFSLFLYKASSYIIYLIYSSNYSRDEQYLITTFLSYNFFSQLPVFVIGLIAYQALNVIEIQKKMVLIGLLIFSSFSFIALLFGYKHIVGNHIVLSVGLAVFSLILRCYPSRLFVNSIIMQFGKVSFSMYLTHFGVLKFFESIGFSGLFRNGDVSCMLYFFCVVFFTYIVSYFFYKTIEKNGIYLGKVLIEKFERIDLSNNSKVCIKE